MKRFTILFSVLLLIALTVSVAYAVPPEKETFEGIDEYPLFSCGDFGLGDFTVMLREEYSGFYSTHYDGDGNLVKEVGRVSGIDTLYVDGYPERAISGNYHLNWTLYPDPETGEWMLEHDSGLPWNIQLPGYGNLIHYSGTTSWLYDPAVGDWQAIKEAGLRYFDPVPLCEYLAPPA